MFQRDRLGERGRDVNALQIPVHVGVKIELAQFHQLHHRGPQEHLRVRADPKQRLLGIDRFALGKIRKTVALFERYPPVFYDHDDRSRVMMRLPLGAEDAVDETFPFLAVVIGLIGARESRLHERKDQHDDDRCSRHRLVPPAGNEL